VRLLPGPFASLHLAVARLGVALPSRMLGELDQVVTAVGYPSRSKAIQNAVESLIVKNRWLSEQKGEKTGVLILVYDHDTRGLEEYLTDTEHQYSSIICSTTHVHLTKRECLSHGGERRRSQNQRTGKQTAHQEGP